MKYYTIPSNNSSVTEKHVVEDDILFTNRPAGKRLKIAILDLWKFLVAVHLSVKEYCRTFTARISFSVSGPWNSCRGVSLKRASEITFSLPEM